MAHLSERVSLGGLLSLLAGVGAVLVVVAGGLVAVQIERVAGETDEVATVYEPAAEAVATLVVATSDMERGVSLYALGGVESDLRPYASGRRRSEIALGDLLELLGTDPRVAPLVAAVADSRNEWLTTVAEPTNAATREGERQQAQRLLIDDDSVELFDELVTDVGRLDNAIDAERSDAFDALGQRAGFLFLLALAVMAVLFGAVLLAWWLLFRWVLAPLRTLRSQMRAAAEDHEVSGGIRPTGPPEIQAVGRDAEHMRRMLVEEIARALRATDAARRAQQSLDSDAPLVAAIERELTARTDPNLPGVWVHGEIHPAETVLAGDFWDTVGAPDGRTALVVTDVAGHGPTVGVAAARLKHLLAVALASGRSPGSALQLAHRRLADENEPIATAAIVVVDPVQGRLSWANAGHHPPLIVRAGGEVAELERTGPLLSWLGGPWDVRQADMGAQDCLLLFSDGLVESHDDEGRQLDADGVVTMFRRAQSEGGAPSHWVRRTLALARERARDWERDDVTLVALTLAPPAEAAPGAEQ